MNLLLDTNILVYLARARDANKIIDFISAEVSNLYVSVVSVAEIRSLAVRNKWGKSRLDFIESFWDGMNVVEITQLYVNAYAQIDAFSQRLNPDFVDYPFATPRNMGKNDLWIASLAALLGLALVTTDGDFDHLHDVFFPVRRIKPSDLQIFV